MIEVYLLPPVWGLPTANAYGLKLLTFLKLYKLPHELKTGDAESAPDGKWPYIRHQGKIIGDSNRIISHLASHYQLHIERELGVKDRAYVLCIQRLIEEHLYWIILYSRFIDPMGWKTVAKDFFLTIPADKRGLVATQVREQFRQKLESHGLGKYPMHEVYEFAHANFCALSDILQQQEYLFGKRPCSIDATLFGFLAAIYFTPLNTEFTQILRRYHNLTAYCQRMNLRLHVIS